MFLQPMVRINVSVPGDYHASPFKTGFCLADGLCLLFPHVELLRAYYSAVIKSFGFTNHVENSQVNPSTSHSTILEKLVVACPFVCSL